MKSIIILLVLFGCGHALGYSNFISNPYLPYPPGCAGFPGQAKSALTQTVAFNLPDGYSREPITLHVQAYRQACSEAGRSLIWLQITTPAKHRNQFFSVELPTVWASPANSELGYLMRLATSPNGWGSNSDLNFHQIHLENWPNNVHQGPNGPLWTFLLDAAAPWNVYNFPSLSASQYNENLHIHMGSPEGSPDGSGVQATIQIGATSELLETEPGLPLSGLLSGNWVMDGAVDQGFTLSILSQVENTQTQGTLRTSLPLILFLAQFTYDQDGKRLWLTGAAGFTEGSRKLTLQIERVNDGEFMGERRATREHAGTVTITANSCDDLTFEYDYTELGLGTGSRQLQRPFSLETAGYDCRDYEARVQANR